MKGFVRIKRRLRKNGESISFSWVMDEKTPDGKVRQKYLAYLGTIHVVGNQVSKSSQARFARSISSLPNKLKLTEKEYLQIRNKIAEVVKRLKLKINY